MAAHLCARIDPRDDMARFAVAVRGKKRRRGAQVEPRAPDAFTLERLLAVAGAIAGESAPPRTPQALSLVATLTSLGLLSGMAGLSGGRLRCEAPPALVHRVAANLRFDLAKYV